MRFWALSALETSVAERPVSVKCLRIEIHHDLAGFAAVRQGDGGALHRCQLRADEVGTQIVKRLFTQRLAGKCELQNGHAGGVVFYDGRRENAGRQNAQNRLRNCGYLRNSKLYFRGGLEKGPDYRDAIVGLRFDVLNIVDGGGKGPLRDGGDALFHLIRRNSGITPDYADNGNIDIGENVGGHCDGGRNSKNYD